VLFFIKDFLELKNYTGLFLFLYFVSAICFMPIWNIIAKKISPVRLLKIGMIGSILTFFWCYFLGSGSLYSYSLICIFSGIFFGIDLTIPPVLTSLLIEKHNQQNSKMLIFSINHFIGKIGLALISGILLIILGKVSSDYYLGTLHIFYTLIPCVLKLIAFVLIKFVKIT
jgi:Na+/melibiose symporter-like transporter